MAVIPNRFRYDSAVLYKCAVGTVFVFVILIVLGVLPHAIN